MPGQLRPLLRDAPAGRRRGHGSAASLSQTGPLSGVCNGVSVPETAFKTPGFGVSNGVSKTETPVDLAFFISMVRGSGVLRGVSQQRCALPHLLLGATTVLQREQCPDNERRLGGDICSKTSGSKEAFDHRQASLSSPAADASIFSFMVLLLCTASNRPAKTFRGGEAFARSPSSAPWPSWLPSPLYLSWLG